MAARAKMKVLAPKFGKQGLFCGKILTAWKGKYIVWVYDSRDKLIAMKQLTVKKPEPCLWQTVGIGDGKVNKLVKSGEPWPVSRNGFAATPGYQGIVLIWTPKDATLDAKAGKTSLPGKIDSHSPWNARYIRKETRKGHEAPELLRLTLEKNVFVLRSDVPIVINPQKRLLARWWLNGKAVVAKHADMRFMGGAARELNSGKEIRLGFALPASLGKLRVGDRVSVQMLYTPEPFEQLPREQTSEKMATQEMFSARVKVPLLSNRLGFVVTDAMLQAGDQPAAETAAKPGE